jgi:pyruvate-formate lyase-activating enzyme
MRKAPFKTYEECQEVIDFLAANGIERIDITGGEPCYHPRIVDIVEYAEKVANIRVRLITLGQLLHREVKERGKSLLDALVEDAEITDFLFSVHSVDGGLFRLITKGSFEHLDKAMARLDARGFSYCTNTMVYARNANEPERIARYIISNKRKVRIVNFINMNLYYAWRGSELGQLVNFSTTSSHVVKAVKMLEEQGIGANVRFGPMCQFRGLEKNYVGITSIGFDPYEWMNGTDAQFELEPFDREAVYKRARQKLMLNNKVFSDKCKECTAKMICDGMDRNYLEQKGDSELKAYTKVEFKYRLPWEIRSENTLANQVKNKWLNGMRQVPVASDKAQEGGLWGTLTAMVGGIKKVSYYKMNDHVYLLEHIARRKLGKNGVTGRGDVAVGDPVLQLDPGASVELELPYRVVGRMQARVSTMEEGAIRISSQRLDKRVPLMAGQNLASVKVNVASKEMLRLINEGRTAVRMVDPVVLMPKGIGKIGHEAAAYLRAYGLGRTLKKIQAFSMRKGRGSRASR